MFNDINGMVDHLNQLKEIVDKKIEERKRELNFKCEVCKINSIEIIYKASNFTQEYIEDNQIKYILNAHYFCKSCYRHVVNTNQLEKSMWMADIDKEIF